MRVALQRKYRFQLISGLVCLLLMFLNQESFGQTWQWGKRGGSGNSIGIGFGFERVLDMTTDPNGNVYFLAKAKAPNINVDGQIFSGIGQGDIVFGSYDCIGGVRWLKLLGGAGEDVSTSIFHSIKSDAQGHIYIAGYMSNAPTFSTDTLHPSTGKRLFLAQYDTMGTFQWLRMPQPDTVSSTYTNRYRFLDMEVDAQGNVYYFGTFNQGQLAGTSILLPALGPYILKYDVQGNLVDVIELEMQIPFGTNVYAKFARDANNGRFYFSGQYNAGNFSINGQAITKEAFVVAFNSQGQFLWKRENSFPPPNNCGFFAKPAIDAQGSIYLAGTSRDGDVFNGYTVVNSMVSLLYRIPFLVKLDSNGSNIWAKNGSATGATTCDGLVLNNSEVIIAGGYGRLIFANEDTLYHAPNQGYDVYLGRFDQQTGALTSLDSIASTFGASDFGYALASANNNIFVGGEFASQLLVGPDTLLSHGGETDFFIAKFGYPCGCTPPTASFSFTANGSTPQINFLYTGTSNVDSMRWDFGDGTTATAVNPQHTFPGNGTYNVCVKVFNPCGVDSSCQTITINCPVPVPSFSFMYAGDTVLFSYTGTPADSIHWDFGDGQSATGSSPSHHYAGDGTYTVCATAYNGCGSEDTCMTVVILDVEDLYGGAAITVFPNPAKEYLQVEGLKSSCGYKLYNVVGSTVQEGVIDANTGRINLQQLPAGTYLLELRGEASVMRVKVFKE